MENKFKVKDALNLYPTFYDVRLKAILRILSSLQSHLEEGGNGLSPYCDLLPGGKFGSFLQLMQDLYYYMLLMGNNNFVDDRVVCKRETWRIIY